MKRKFNRNDNIMTINNGDGEPIVYHTIKLWLIDNDIDDDDKQRYTTYIKNNPDVSGARQFVGNWMLPETTEIDLPDAGSRRSSWGDNVERVIVGLTPAQLDIVVNEWQCRVRYPTRERNERKQKQSTTTTTTTTTTTEPETINGKPVTIVPDAIPSIDTINASIDGARRKLIDNINASLTTDK